MSVRTYNPSVRVGNWNEDLCLEEVTVLYKFIILPLSTRAGSVERFHTQERIRSVTRPKDSQFTRNPSPTSKLLILPIIRLLLMITY